MSLIARINIALPPEQIWPLITDPLQMARWNPKIISIERKTNGPVHLGEKYAVLYRMEGKERLFQEEVVGFESFSGMVWRHRFDEDPSHYVLETYLLRSSGAGTRVEHQLDLSHSGVPWLVRLLAAFTTRFGWTVGVTILQGLKRMAEAAAQETRCF